MIALIRFALATIRCVTHRHFSAEEKIRIVLVGLRSEDSIAELYRRRAKMYLLASIGCVQMGVDEGATSVIRGRMVSSLSANDEIRLSYPHSASKL
jgi:hypothetical protein